MNFINYLSNAIIPLVITIIIIFAMKEKVKIFDTFLDGAKEGAGIVFALFPTLIGLFVAIGTLRSSGFIDFLINLLSPIINMLGLPKEVMPLAFLRPISGSASIAIGTDIMKQYGVDSNIGLIVSTIMGSTETTLYTIAIYTSVVKIKKTRGILLAALIGDFIRNVEFCSILSNFVVKKMLTIIRICSIINI